MSSRPEIKKWASLLAVIGFTFFLVYLFFFTDIAQVTIIISSVSVPIYSLVFVFVIGQAAFNSLAWKATLDNVSVNTTFKRVFYLGWVGAFLDCLIVGGWSGDILMTYLLGGDEGVDVVKVAASVIVKDILELLVTLLSLIIGMILLILNYSINTFILVAIGITMSFFALPLILIVYLSTNISITKKILQFLVRIIARIKRKKPDDAFEQRIATQIANFHDVIMIIKKKPKSMIKPMIFQTMTWVCSIAALFFVFVSIRTSIGVDIIIITNTIVSTISNQGVALSGFSQIISSGLYNILGINMDLAQASSLLAGFASFWFVFVISFVFFQIYGLGTIEEKILNKAYKEKQKRARKDFKEQTDSHQRDFEENLATIKNESRNKRENREKDFAKIESAKANIKNEKIPAKKFLKKKCIMLKRFHGQDSEKCEN
jgi:glycosyltransferase 2 family protein